MIDTTTNKMSRTSDAVSPLILWSVIQGNVNIIAACIPTISPFMRLLLNKSNSRYARDNDDFKSSFDPFRRFETMPRLNHPSQRRARTPNDLNLRDFLREDTTIDRGVSFENSINGRERSSDTSGEAVETDHVQPKDTIDGSGDPYRVFRAVEVTVAHEPRNHEDVHMPQPEFDRSRRREYQGHPLGQETRP